MADKSQGAEESKLHRLRRTVAMLSPLLILVGPSFWLMMAVPPLWRDVDAYVQTVYPLNANTILLHAPLYCILSRVPLWLGYLFSGAGPAVRLGHFIKHTQLTDAGVFALVLTQHAALWGAAFYLINSITTNLGWRLVLAGFFASQSLFYAFAHCIGSETLSMIITVLLAAAGLRIVLRYPDIVLRDWIVFGASLCGAILTRHINGVLVALLPTTILLIALVQSLPKSRVQHVTSSGNFTFGRSARVWCASVVTALSALILASTFTHLLCWHAHIHWRSKFGFTFVWRLNFLSRVPVGSRDQFLAAAASKCQLPDTRQLFVKLAERSKQEQPWEPTAFVAESRPLFFDRGGKLEDERFDRSLNEMAYALLYPPSSALWSAALQDFWYATTLSETDVVHYLFNTTDYFFSHRGALEQWAGLKTFREPRTELLRAANNFYLQWWKLISFRTWSIIYLLVVLIVILLNRKSRADDGRVILYAVILCIVGATMVLLNCFIAAIQPRFALPMMELLLLSMMILFGVIFRARKISWRREASEPISSPISTGSKPI